MAAVRVIVCGGRDYQNSHVVNGILADYPISLLIHGDTQGADRLAGLYAMSKNIPVAIYPANWLKFGKSAGPIRNRQMIKEGKPDLVIAFPGGNGTADMVKVAQAAGIETIEVVEDTRTSRA